MTDNIDFQYLVGHTFNDTRQYNDWDAGEFNFYIDYFLSELDLTSHEFQFTGGDDRFSWVGGAYMWDQSGRARNPAYSMADWVEATPGYTNVGPAVLICHPDSTERSLQHDARPARRHELGAARGRGLRAAVRLGLNVNSVNGWPFPCDFIPGAAGWVTALAGGARPPAGDTLTGNEIDGYALFGEVNIGLGEKFDLTIGYRFHDQSADQATSTSPPALPRA